MPPRTPQTLATVRNRHHEVIGGSPDGSATSASRRGRRSRGGGGGHEGGGVLELRRQGRPVPGGVRGPLPTAGGGIRGVHLRTRRHRGQLSGGRAVLAGGERARAGAGAADRGVPGTCLST